MNNWMKPAAFFLTSLCAGGAIAQTQAAPTDEIANPASGTSAVAYVYVQNVKVPGHPKNGGDLYGFAAAANGQLTSLAGSPYNYNVTPQADNGTFMFGMESNNSTIDSFRVASNGVPSKVDSLNTAAYDTGTCGYAGFFQIDKTGSKLYNVAFTPDCTASRPEDVQSYSINGSTGQLGFMSQGGEMAGGAVHLSVLGNNDYSYMVDVDIEGPQQFGFATYKRLSNGVMQLTGDQWLLPAGSLGPESEEPGATFFWPELTATDASNHLVAILHEYDQDLNDFGEYVAVYTVASNGNLSTTNTFAQLPSINGNATSVSVSSSQKLLAVGGDGLEVLHYNGASAPTAFKTLLAGQPVQQVSWDKTGHLYAIVLQSGNGKLHVFNTSATSITEAPGSPYSIANPEAMVVQSK